MTATHRVVFPFLGFLALGLLVTCSDSTVEPAGDAKATDSAPIADLIRDIHVTDGDAAKDGPPGKDGPQVKDGPTSPDAAGPPKSFEGYGAVTKGAASAPGGATTYHVTSLSDSGAGTLRDAISKSGRRIVFDKGGTITLKTDLVLKQPYLTIDGTTAPGITIRKTTISNGEVIIAGTHDIIVTGLRFHGLFKQGAPNQNNAATIAIDGDANPDHVAKRIILDHLTSRNATDGGPDIWGEVQDVTVSWCLFFYNWHPTTISHYPAPYQVRQRISMHHNVYAKNGERNPQIRADVRQLDHVNNVIYDWGYYSTGNFGYGIRIKNNAGEPKVNANLVQNAFLLSGKAPHTRYEHALIYGTVPGPDAEDGAPSGATPAQGTVIKTTKLGQLWVKDHYSTVSAPLTIPAAAKVTTYAAQQLKTKVLPFAGAPHRTAEETALLAEIASNW
jgi:pectate lyase